MALKLVGEISLDGSGFKRGLQGVQSGLDSIKGQLAAAFSVGAITALAKKTIEYAGHLTDLADRLKVSTDYLQEMQYVVKQNGASVEDLTATFEKLGEARINALRGDVKAQQNFASLGVSMGDLQTKGTQGILDTIAGTFKQLGNNDVIKTAFKEIGGKGAGVLVPAFIDGIDEGRQKARDAGVVMSAEAAMQLDAIGDKFDAIGIQLMTGIAPAILVFADSLQYLADHIEQSQAAVGEFLGNIMGAASITELKQADERARKFNEMLKGRVSIGELTKEQADAQRKQVLSKADISKLDLMAGVGEAVAKVTARQDAEKMANAASVAAKIAAREKPDTIGNISNLNAGRYKGGGDSLISVGNFLGSSRGAIEQIAQKQLVELQKHSTKLDEVIKKLTGMSWIGTPPGN